LQRLIISSSEKLPKLINPTLQRHARFPRTPQVKDFVFPVNAKKITPEFCIFDEEKTFALIKEVKLEFIDTLLNALNNSDFCSIFLSN
jgi:hypothetical protein